MGHKRKKQTALSHFVEWQFPSPGPFESHHTHFSESKSEIYHGMHPTLDDSRVSSTMRSFRPKYRKITPEARSFHNFTNPSVVI